MHSGMGQLLTVGDTIVSEHMATLDHDIDDIEVRLLGFEQDWNNTIQEYKNIFLKKTLQKYPKIEIIISIK